MMMTMIRTAPALVLFMLILSGCDATSDQAEFRVAASAIPFGIFRTDDGFTPLNGENDPDDWRTAPIYATSGFVVNRRASPNPARIADSEVVTIEVLTSEGIPGGLQLVARDGFGGRVVLSPFEEIPGGGFQNFSFFVTEILGAQVGELWRLILFDSRGEPVTYGDLLIE